MAVQFAEWKITLYRAVRAAIGAGIAQALILQPDWSKPEEAGKVLLVAFVTGFSVSLGRWLREALDTYFGQDEKSLVAKTMVI